MGCLWKRQIELESIARRFHNYLHLRDEAKRASIGLSLRGLSIITSITGSVVTNTTYNTSLQMSGGLSVSLMTNNSEI